MKTKRAAFIILNGIGLVFLAIACTSRQSKPEPKVFSASFTSEIGSFNQYQYPVWFRDAKFGIWSHWGPQAVPRQGDWYARKMYESDIVDRRTQMPTGKQGREYLYHLEHYGHPSKFGYKDIIPLWKAERWDPGQLMALYKRVGARYFVSMATHHDNFFLCYRLGRWRTNQFWNWFQSGNKSFGRRLDNASLQTLRLWTTDL